MKASACFALVCLFGSATAYANECLDGPNAWRTARAYERSYERAQYLVEARWEMVGQDCTQLDCLDEQVSYALEGAGDGLVSRCRAMGMWDGAGDTLEGLHDYCFELGSIDGADVGTYEGERFCRMMFSYNGGFEYEVGFRNACTISFTNAVRQHCPNRLGGQDFHMVMGDVCQPF